MTHGYCISSQVLHIHVVPKKCPICKSENLKRYLIYMKNNHISKKLRNKLFFESIAVKEQYCYKNTGGDKKSYFDILAGSF